MLMNKICNTGILSYYQKLSVHTLHMRVPSIFSYSFSRGITEPSENIYPISMGSNTSPQFETNTIRLESKTNVHVTVHGETHKDIGSSEVSVLHFVKTHTQTHTMIYIYIYTNINSLCNSIFFLSFSLFIYQPQKKLM